MVLTDGLADALAVDPEAGLWALVVDHLGKSMDSVPPVLTKQTIDDLLRDTMPVGPIPEPVLRVLVDDELRGGR